MAIEPSALARGQVYLVRLDLTLGSEIKKTRPDGATKYVPLLRVTPSAGQKRMSVTKRSAAHRTPEQRRRHRRFVRMTVFVDIIRSQGYAGRFVSSGAVLRDVLPSDFIALLRTWRSRDERASRRTSVRSVSGKHGFGRNTSQPAC